MVSVLIEESQSMVDFVCNFFTFSFQIRSYDLSEVFYRTEDEKKYEVFKIADQQKYVYEDEDSNEVDQEMEGQRLEQEIRLKNELTKNR